MKKILLMTTGLLSACTSGPIVSGVVRDRASLEQAGVLVRMISVDDTGRETAEVDRALTGSDGRFVFRGGGEAGASILVQAEIPTGALRAFAAAEDIDAVSEALVQAVLQVTETAGGRTLGDFTRDEIRGIDETMRDAFPDATALTDADAVLSAGIAAAGRSIPDAAGGVVAAVASAAFEPADATETAPAVEDCPTCTCSQPVVLVTGDLFVMDLEENGQLCSVDGNGTTLVDTFDGAFTLSLVGDTFPDTGDGRFPGGTLPGDPARTIEDGREYVFGPVTTAGGLEVTRKVYIPEGRDQARYLEILDNPTAADTSVSVQATGFVGMGSDLAAPTVLAESEADGEVNGEDDWAVYMPATLGKTSPSAGILWNTERTLHRADTALFPPQNGNDAFLLRWDDVTVPAGGRKVVAYFARVMASFSGDETGGWMGDLFVSPDFTGMSSSELANLENLAATRGNITGEAGSVVSGSTVTATSAGGESVSVKAAADGSFALIVPAVSGETVQVTATDGYSQALVVP